MYLDDIAARIRSHIANERMPDENAEELMRLYAVLLRAKGRDVTESDIHDAWSMWMTKYQKNHESLVPYEDLKPEVRAQDSVFANAVRQTAKELKNINTPLPMFEKVLFPLGPPIDTASTQQTMDLYKIMVSSSESLVSRRQAVNTFFFDDKRCTTHGFWSYCKRCWQRQVQCPRSLCLCSCWSDSLCRVV